jgi:hypothetical protein
MSMPVGGRQLYSYGSILHRPGLFFHQAFWVFVFVWGLSDSEGPGLLDLVNLIDWYE